VNDLFSKTGYSTTKLCAVYGQPVKHSASPAMHNSALAELGLDWQYIALEVPPEELSKAIEQAKAARFIGLNLTVPHKILALDMVDILDNSAKKWGAVNTICFEAKEEKNVWTPLGQATDLPMGELRTKGYNTDADGITLALQNDLKLNLKNLKVLFLGAGGAGRVAALKLAEEKVAKLYLVNRTISKAEELATEIKKRYSSTSVHVGYPKNISEKIDLILNSTSLGLNESDPLPIDENKFSLVNADSVFDMIYNPAETKLLAKAKASGCNTSNGLGMLLWQGVKALEIWSGQTAPVEVMRNALTNYIYGNE
jgi:shikimate dehydrogenase